MKIISKAGKWKQKEIEGLIVPVGLKEQAPAGLPSVAEQLFNDAVERKEFSGKLGEIKHFILPMAGNKTGIRHVFFAGTGKSSELKIESYAKTVGQIMRTVQSARIGNVGFWLRDMLVSSFPQAEHFGEVLAQYATMAGYEFNEYRKTKTPQIKQLTLFIENKRELEPVAKGAKRGAIIGAIVNESRDLGNHPGNVATPVHLTNFIRETAKKEPVLQVKALSEKEMERLGMGCILGVARGSEQEAQFIIVEYWGTDKKEKPYVVIGKAVTFDSGGISIKPSAAMDEMKYDMSGGSAALGIVRTAAELKLKLNVIALIPAAENMPGPNAYKPGDILKAMDGTMVEVLNTDAEGRLLLADALVYARQYKPQTVIDLATLTGACAVALHDAGAGLFTTDTTLQTELKQAGEKTGDVLWPLPLPPEYRELIKSKTADIANIAPMPWGGAITAAAFLQHFAAPGKFAWAHLDIAGVAWANSGKKHLAGGATGAGIRAVVEWLRSKEIRQS